MKMFEKEKEAAKYIREYMKNNPDVKDLAPMYESYPANDRRYISQALIGIGPWNYMSYIPDLAFMDCKDITRIVLPSGVTSIGAGAFDGCKGLERITIPNSVTKIGFCAFNNCTSLTSIVIPDSVMSIGGSAFDGCTMISSVSLGKGVALVKTNAFPDCFMLSTMSIHNPKTCFEKNSIDTTNLTDINYMGTCDEFLRYFNLNAFIEGDDTININCSDGILRAKYFQDVNRYKFIF